MSGFTRLTVVGSARRAELVVPDDEAVSGIVARLLDLLAEPVTPSARPSVLVRATGEQLQGALSTSEQQVADGEQLRLVRADEAPPPPEVADVTDVLADSFEGRRGRWGRSAREVAGSVGIGTLLAVASFLTPRPFGAVVALAVGVLSVGAAALGRSSRRWGAVAATAAAAGLAPQSALLLADLPAWTAPRAVVVPAATAVVGWCVLALGVGVGLGRRPVLVGSLLGALLGALPLALVAGPVPPVPAVGVMAVAAVLAGGVLPWWALSVSGLTGLDDQVLTGAPRSRTHVQATVEEAYACLSWATFAVALPLGLGAGLLLGQRSAWSVSLGLVVLLATALRTRAFPLTVQQLPLWAAALLGLGLGVVRQPRLEGWPGVVLLVVVAGLAVVAVGLKPAAHVRARLRQIGNVVESVAVVACLPLLLGVFGLYSALIGSFR